MKCKIRAEYSNAIELPPALLRKEAQIKRKRQAETEEQSNVADEQTEGMQMIDELAKSAKQTNAPLASSSSSAVVLHSRNNGINQMQLTRAVPLRPDEADVPLSSAALIRSQIHVTPKPKWHAPWKLMRVISGHLGWVRSVTVDSSNQWFATGAADRVIKIWDLASGTLKLSLTGHISTVRGLVSSPRHPYLFSCGDDKQIKCWDLETNKVIRHYHGHLSGIHSIALHPTLDVLITGSRDSVARVSCLF